MVNLDEIILKTAQRETLELDEREGGEIPDVDLYGFVVPPILQSSVSGIFSGLPYTVADDENTNFLTLCFLITSSKLSAPEILFVKTN